MATHFSTSSVPASSRLEFWREIVCRTYVSVGCSPLESALEANVSVHDFGPAQLSDITSSPMSYSRTADDIRSGPSDDLQLCLIREGGVAIAQSGREAVLKAGDLALYDAARPFSLKFGEQYRGLILKLPRAVLSARLPDIEKLTALRLSGETKLGALARTVICESVQFDDPVDQAIATRLSGSVMDILSVAIETELRGPRVFNSRHAAVVERIKQYMIGNLGDPELDIAAIADACHVAPRTIHRLFAAEGTTAIRWLWQQRLTASYRALAECQVSQVSEAAINCGFSDFSHFTRAFKKAFGVVPHSVLRVH